VNAGPTAERVYETLRRAIMERRYRPGERLDPGVVAEQLNTSTTPVREALDRLVGEELVETRTGSGFHLPALDEPALKDLYLWSAEVLALALRGWPRDAWFPGSNWASGESSSEPIADRAARLFAAIATRSLNSEHGRAIDRLNARLHAVRTVEPLVLETSAAALEPIAAAARVGDKAALQRAIGGYHRQRIRAAAAIVRALYRAG